jgi:serine/threonine protein kinase/WD40 repeat protein
MNAANRAQELFDQALQFDSVEERAAFLARACSHDAALRERVERLLAAHEKAGAFLDRPPCGECATVVTLPINEEGPGTLIGRYKLLEKVGEGGCGVVYVAEQTEPVRRRVALKVIKLGMDTKAVVARFEAERQALAMMDHPNIAKVLDAGTTETGRPYFVMELVRGIRITDYCDQERVSTQERLELFIKVCQAIQHAHQKGIIHRDIKPSNILVTLHDGVPVPKVIDFGIAKATEGRLTDATLYTQLHQFIGTPAYMSPEQAEMSGLDIDTRSDIYSLGVLLYELLTGKTPFEPNELMSQGIDAMRKTIREKEPVRPSTKVATLEREELTTTAKRRSSDAPKLIHLLEGDLDWIVMKCLEKDRTRRYETANGLAADLKRHLNLEPVTARPPSFLYRIEKAARRNKLLFGSGAAVGLALVLGVVVSSLQAARANHKAQEARTARGMAERRLYESLLSEAQALRLARQVGYRSQVFARLQQAQALTLSNASQIDLRREAVGCLGDFVGLDPVDMKGLPGEVRRLDFHPSEPLALMFCRDEKPIVLKALDSGNEIAWFPAPDRIRSLVFTKDGKKLLGISLGKGDINSLLQNSILHSWICDDGHRWVAATDRPVPGAYTCYTTSSGRVLLAIADQDHAETYLQDLETKDRLITFQKSARFVPCIISSDGRFAAVPKRESGGRYGATIDIWDLASRSLIKGLQLKAELLGVLGVNGTFSPDGRYLGVIFASSIVVYRMTDFEQVADVPGWFHDGTIAFGRDWVAVALPQENAIRILNLLNREQIAYLRIPDRPTCIAVSTDGASLLCAHRSGLRLFQMTLKTEKLSLQGHTGGVTAIEFSPNGKQIATTSKDHSVIVWDAQTGERIQTFADLPAYGQTLTFSPDGKYLACGLFEHPLVPIWSLATGKQVLELGTGSDRGHTLSCAFSPDFSYFVTAGCGLRIYKVLSNQDDSKMDLKLTQMESDTNAFAENIDFSRDGSMFSYIDKGPQIPTVFVRNVKPGSIARRVTSSHMAENLQDVSFLPNNRIVYVTNDREVEVWDEAANRVITSFPTLPTPVNGQVRGTFTSNLRASPDGTKFALASATSLGVDIYDLQSHKLLYSLPEEIGAVWWLAWSPDNERVAVARANGAVAVWNLKEVEQVLARAGLGEQPDLSQTSGRQSK